MWDTYIQTHLLYPYWRTIMDGIKLQNWFLECFFNNLTLQIYNIQITTMNWINYKIGSPKKQFNNLTLEIYNIQMKKRSTSKI